MTKLIFSLLCFGLSTFNIVYSSENKIRSSNQNVSLLMNEVSVSDRPTQKAREQHLTFQKPVAHYGLFTTFLLVFAGFTRITQAQPLSDDAIDMCPDHMQAACSNLFGADGSYIASFDPQMLIARGFGASPLEEGIVLAGTQIDPVAGAGQEASMLLDCGVDVSKLTELRVLRAIAHDSNALLKILDRGITLGDMEAYNESNDKSK